MTTRGLPDFVKPMLAKSGEPFDSDEHLFEIKWDGLRTSVYVERGTHRLRSRRGRDMTERYPELSGLGQLPEGTVLDGELVAFDQQGRPDFRAVLSREQARSKRRIEQSVQAVPVTLVAFDQLYADHESLLARPLEARRETLRQTVAGGDVPRLIMSDGVIGPGKKYFEQAVASELEGLVAKRLDSRYLPGRRSDAWIKMRKRSSLLCAIIGYVPKGEDFESLILATDDSGELHCVGRVGNGFDSSIRRELTPLLRLHECDEPLIPCQEQGQWVKAGLYCSVRFLERTSTGYLREPIFERIVS